MRRRFACPAVLLAAALVQPLAGTAAGAVPMRALAPHRAIYDITLARSGQASGVSSASGRMVFEITGSECVGYHQRQRMKVNMSDDEGNENLLDIQFTSFETGSGDEYTFDSKTSLNSAVVEEVKGKARRSASGLKVDITLPARRTVNLAAGALFPNQHLKAILDAAVAQRSFVSSEIYEGTAPGDSTDQASVSIGKAVANGAGGPLRDGLKHWPVSVGYFDDKADASDGAGEELPSYQMQFTLYENGVTNDLVIDHGDYALAGALKQVQPLDSPACPAGKN